MRKRLFYLLIFLIQTIRISAQDAKEIIRKSDEKSRGNTSISEISMRIIRPGWTREMSMRAWTSGKKLVMIQVLSPAKERGVVYLRKDKEVWNWIPSIERNIKLPPSMMSQSWMGTDFTNDDLVREFSIVEDYDHTLEGEEMVEDRLCYRIRMIPKAEAAIVWARVVVWIDKQDLVMMKAEYFDEDELLVNRMRAVEVKNLGGRILPAELEMTPMNKKGQKTIIIYRSVAFDQPLGESFFTIHQMQKLP